MKCARCGSKKVYRRLLKTNSEGKIVEAEPICWKCFLKIPFAPPETQLALAQSDLGVAITERDRAQVAVEVTQEALAQAQAYVDHCEFYVGLRQKEVEAQREPSA